MDDCTEIDIPEYVFHNVESSCQTELSCSCSCAQSSKRPSRTFGTQTETRMSTEEISEYLVPTSLLFVTHTVRKMKNGVTLMKTKCLLGLRHRML